MDILQLADIILFSTAFLVLIIATITDLKKREVPNWLNFSFLGFAIFVRLISFLFSWNYAILINTGICFAAFFIIGNIFYYSQVFAGGDLKLLYGLAIAFSTNPFFYSIQNATLAPGLNEPFILAFLINAFVVGAVYGIIFSIYSIVKNKSSFQKFIKSFNKGLRKRDKGFTFLLILCAILSIVLIFMSIIDRIFIVFLILILILPFLFLLLKIVEKEFMIKLISVNKLTEGDWLVEKIKVKNKIIKPNIHGLSIPDVLFLKKYCKNKIKIQEGLPFVPGFLLSLILTLFFGDLLFRFISMLV